MKNAREKKFKIPWGSILWFLSCMVIGGLIGILMAENKMDYSLVEVAVLTVSFVMSVLLHVLIHEAGHMVCGFMTGYRFVSYRIGSLMWEKQADGHIRLSRFSLAGTGGQCLMAPPDYDDGKFPYVLYNLGGGLANFVTAAVCGLLLLLPAPDYVFIFLWMMILVAVLLGGINLIPIRKLNNDGSNIVQIGKSPAARRAFWLQMRVNEETSKGVRLKDMPDAWFAPQVENRRNIMVTSIDVLAANRWMDCMQMDAAEEKMKMLMHENYLAAIYRNLLTFELSFIEMMKGEPGRYTEKTRDAQLQQFAKAMRKFPNILRWEYAKAKLMDQNDEKADKIRLEFEKMAVNYPHPCELVSEREWMDRADKRADTLDA